MIFGKQTYQQEMGEWKAGKVPDEGLNRIPTVILSDQIQFRMFSLILRSNQETIICMPELKKI